MPTPVAAGFTVAGGVWRVTSAPTAANCTFTYNPSAAAGAPPTITAIVTTGC